MLQSIFKKFELWFQLKQKLDDSECQINFNEGEIWMAHLGVNIGHEENGKGELFLRPVAVIKKFSRNLAIIVPTTTRFKDNKYYFALDLKKGTSYALLSHVKSISPKRFKYKMAKLSDSDLIILQKHISKIFLTKN
jgi:mRNA-degrading endonuclease toxin of MazEF toxin-antitoxin module